MEVLRKSAPPSIAASAASADQRGVGELAGLEDRLQRRVAADVLDLAHRGGDYGGVRRRATCAPGHDQVDLVGAVAEGVARVRLHRLDALVAAGEVDHRGDADAGVGERGLGLRHEARPDADRRDRALRGLGAAAQLGDRPPRRSPRRGWSGRGRPGRGGRRSTRSLAALTARPSPCGSAVKAPGSSAPTVVRARSPARSARMTGVSGAANSASFWRQPPQGGTGSGLSAITQHLGDLAPAGEAHRGDGAGLGAGALRVGDVLDVAAAVDAAVRAADRRADLEAGIGRVGVLARGAGGLEQVHRRRAPVAISSPDYGPPRRGVGKGGAPAERFGGSGA